MTKPLLITSNEVLFDSIKKEFKLKQITPILYEGKCNKKAVAITIVSNSKLDSTIYLTHLLSTSEYSKLIILNPVQCPDTNVLMGQIVVADSITEWDKSIRDSRILPLNSLEFKTRVINGKGMSGEKECSNRPTTVLQSKLIDIITYLITKVAEYFNIPILSIGIVADHCTVNYEKLLKSNMESLSSRLLEFLKGNSSVLLEN